MIDEKTAGYGAFLLRVYLGGLFAYALYGKFMIRGIDIWWAALLGAGYPNWVIIYTITAEFVALLLIIGFMTRWVSLFVLPMMLGATHFWMQRKGFSFTEAGYAMPLTWAVMLIVQALLGDGALAVKAPAWLRLRMDRFHAA